MHIELLLLLLFSCCLQIQCLRVELRGGGSVIGVPHTLDTHQQPVYVFQGIPYAKPPTGIRRFSKAEAVGPLPDGFLADRKGPMCAQLDPTTNVVIGDEDCLTINVFIPQKAVVGGSLAVLLLIHDGGFQHGAAHTNVTRFSHFLRDDIIVVTFNYRLGVLGFFSTNLPSAAGNWGLLDQIEAMRWVQNNIGQFGGDANRVTLLGHEAGATSALLHLLSPLSKGLFHGVIALNGSPLSNSALQGNAFHWATSLGDLLYCLVYDPKILVNCLQKRNTEDLLAAAHQLQNEEDVVQFPFLPVVENVWKKDGDFLPDQPIRLLEKNQINHVPVIIGAYGHKNLINEMFVKEGEEDRKELLKKILTLISSELKISERHLHSISEDIVKEYFPNETQLNQTHFHYLTNQLVSDYFIRSSADETVKWLSQCGCPTWMFTFDDNFVPRTDELQFGNDSSNISSSILNIFTTFIKNRFESSNSSAPPPWISVQPTNISYIKVGLNHSTLINEHLTKRSNFWNNIISTYKMQTNRKEEL